MQAWETFLDALEQKMGKPIVERWLRSLKVKDFDACNIHLEAETTFQITWFEEHVSKDSLQEFKNNNGHPIKIHFTNRFNKKKGAAKNELAPLQLLDLKADSLDSSATFDNFIVAPENELPIQFLKEIVPGAFNPLFIHGPPGVGKTHLIMACGHLLRSKGLSVFYIHAETFTEHVVRAIRNSQMKDFRKTYRNQDVLIIDDIHQLARKAATQEELFHTFNALHTAGKQIILCSHLAPSQMEDIEPRLISRFEWGIVLQLKELSPDKLALLLNNRAKLNHFPLTPELTHFLMENFRSSSKWMMRALEALMLRHKGNNHLSVEGAKILLSDLLAEEEKIKLTPEKILQIVSSYFGIRNEDILGKSQSKECVLPRKLAMFFCRKKLNLSYLAIGRFFDRDHSTVMTGIKQIETEPHKPELHLALTEVENLLK